MRLFGKKFGSEGVMRVIRRVALSDDGEDTNNSSGKNLAPMLSAPTQCNGNALDNIEWRVLICVEG